MNLWIKITLLRIKVAKDAPGLEFPGGPDMPCFTWPRKNKNKQSEKKKKRWEGLGAGGEEDDRG